jgi:hypothetical protein
MPFWFSSLLSIQSAVRDAADSDLYEWAEFNLPARDELETLFRANEDENHGRPGAST